MPSPNYSELWTTPIQVEDYHTSELLCSMVYSELWTRVIHDYHLCRATKLSYHHPSLRWAIPDETSLVNSRWHLISTHMMRRMGIWMKMRMFLNFVTSGSRADQIFMVITPNESLAPEFKFRWGQKEKRFVEVIGGLMIRYEGLISWLVGSYQLMWSPAAVTHHCHLKSGKDI